MEENGAMVAKKIWSMLRALYFMLRKGKSKKIKYMLDLSMMIKRRKLAAEKVLISCSNAPLFRVNKIRDGSTSGYRFFLCTHALNTKEEDDVVRVNIESMKATEMLQSDVALLTMTGVGRSPTVRVTDSPYPIREVHDDQDDGRVDEAAEEFIIKFYQNLKMKI
ncbi:Avr9/Cf-9 rapidly elicited protein 146 [Heracleum sosnowskyi]|uniref:Avr9/Cf-9 rapidly elicited protein 146 n=1 Tax=Heracleum sosnowskyi TaxID=360622 RepID=A0AAD8IRC9_9APIA|nr:Avr9/Cf-9 rapidly elicited protein 146 [Heracleum sosnowskyi]